MNKQKWLERARELGIDGFEITQTMRKSREVSWFEHKMDTFVTSRILSTSMRALINDKVVALSMEKVDDEDMDEILNSLKTTAALVSDSEKDELVPVMETELVQSTKVWVEPSAEEIKELLASLEEKLEKADPRITMVNGLEFSSGRVQSELTNSLGVSVAEQGASQVVVGQITMKEDGDLRDGYLVKAVYDIHDFDQDAFVKELVDDVASQMHARSLSSRTCPVVLKGEAMSTLFSCFAAMFYGDTIAKGISPLTGKLHEKIFSDKITVIDDPRNLDSIYLQNYDDEGHPTYAKTVVDKGVFETILHNTKSALKMGAESTGNGFKSGGGATSVSAMNLYIVPGQDDFDTLLKTMDNGVVITDLAGMHAGVDFVSANFSLQARGYLVENGQKSRPLTLITIAGNFLELMKNVEAVGDDLKWEVRSVTCPSILFTEAAIGGNE